MRQLATGGLGYPEFLDAILRYTDNPDEGKVNSGYPAYGGAYFDCDTYQQYPLYAVTDSETKEGFHEILKKVQIIWEGTQ